MKRLLIVLLALFMHSLAWAHKPSDSYLTMRATGGSVDVLTTDGEPRKCAGGAFD